MSKMDQLRALREAKYARATTTQAPTRAAAPVRPTTAAPGRVKTEPFAAKPAEPAEPAEPADTAGEQLCGHRSMNGRTCTREHGHAAKSHRYS